MSRSIVEQVADAVLYEGYILYPYRPSSVKNQQRWTFGGVYPRAYSEAQSGSDNWEMRMECLVEGGADALLDVRVRFLHLLERVAGGPAAWQAASERTVAAEALSLGELAGKGRLVAFRYPADRQEDAERGVVLVQEALQGEMEVSADQRSERLFRVSVVIRNTTVRFASGSCPHRPRVGGAHDSALPRGEEVRERPHRPRVGGAHDSALQTGATEIPALGSPAVQNHPPHRREVGGGETGSLGVPGSAESSAPPTQGRWGQEREHALAHTLVSTHTILHVRGGAFVSLTDPPPGLKEQAEACRNLGTWPVLIGEEGSQDTILSSPIILPDYPQVAPESPGDLFDATEIDEILTLRILTLTDEEKREMAAADERARALLERTEALGGDELLRLHGVMRNLRPRQNPREEP